MYNGFWSTFIHLDFFGEPVTFLQDDESTASKDITTAVASLDGFMFGIVSKGKAFTGGGEEMGGMRGVMHYLQRTAIQGHPQTITEITQQFQVGADQPEANPHVFRKHFELKIDVF